MLVHQLVLSNSPGQVFDAIIYLVAHRSKSKDRTKALQNASLLNVQSVKYYFGDKWGNKIFTISDRFNSFAIRVSAYRPFLCTAEIEYSDRQAKQTLRRYIDFEMGRYAPYMIPEKNSDHQERKGEGGNERTGEEKEKNERSESGDTHEG